MSTQHDPSVQLAERLHCLTCLICDAVERADMLEIQQLFGERSRLIEELSGLGVTPDASDWLEKTSELEQAALASWKKGQVELGIELGQGQVAKRNLKAAYKQAA